MDWNLGSLFLGREDIMAGIGFLVGVILVGYFVYDGFIPRELSENETRSVAARASLVGYYRLHYRHYPERIDNYDDKFIVIDIDNNTQFILRSSVLGVEIMDRSDTKLLFSFSAPCISQREVQFRVLAGERVEQACIAKLPDRASEILTCQRRFPSDCFVTYADSKSEEPVEFRWWFSKIEGHNKPILLLKQIFDWLSDMWSSVTAYFERVNA